MHIQQNWDYLIAGGGLSGLVLALKMQQKLGDFRALIIDRAEKKEDDRTWSYWTKTPEQLPPIYTKSWAQYKIDGPQGESILDFAPYRYYTVQGKDFYDYAKKQLLADPRFTWLTDHIEGVEPTQGVVQTRHHGRFQGQWVFKSYFHWKDLPTFDQHHLLYQQFKGWLIETPTPQFDSETVTLMDFRAKAPSKAIRFNYVLPFSPTQAMVEYTAFTPEILPESVLEEHLRWYLDEVLQIPVFEIRKTEFDAIPMTDYPFRPSAVEKVIHLGTIAGYVKGSSGYCFTRTFEKIDRLVEDLKQGVNLTQRSYASPGLYRLFDSVLLDVMCKNEVPADLIFTNLYTKLSSKTLFGFLDEKANPLEILQVMLVSPNKNRFIQSFTRQLFRFASL